MRLLKILLLVTGVLSVVLFVSAEEVEQTATPSLLEAALTTGFALSLSTFFLVIAVGLSKKMLSDIRKVYHQRWIKCSICDEPLPEASLRQVGRLHAFHYETVHPDACRWRMKWRRKLAIGTIALSVLLFVSGTYIVLVGNLLGFAAMGLATIPLLTLTWLQRLKLRQFRRQWTAKRREV